MAELILINKLSEVFENSGMLCRVLKKSVEEN